MLPLTVWELQLELFSIYFEKHFGVFLLEILVLKVLFALELHCFISLAVECCVLSLVSICQVSLFCTTDFSDLPG